MVKKRLRNKLKNISISPKKGTKQKNKPLDRWLAMAGLAVAIVVPLIPERAWYIVIISLVLMFGSFIHPIWNFWWIEKSLWRQVSALLILLAGLFMFGIYVWPDQIRINPSKFNLSGTQIIEIENMKVKTVYSTWVKIKGQTGHFNFDDITITGETYEGFLSEDLPDVAIINYAVQIFKGFDANEESCVYLLIFRLKPFESRFIKITKSNSKPEEKKSLPLLIEIRGYSNEAPSIPWPPSKNRVTLPEFQPPEYPFKIKSISVFMAKKR